MEDLGDEDIQTYLEKTSLENADSFFDKIE